MVFLGVSAVSFSDATAVQPTFTAPDVGPSGGVLTFEVTVTDIGGLQNTDTCIVNVTWVDLPPTADAGLDQIVNEGTTVTLDASNSTDPDDGIASYQWTQTAGTSVTLSGTTAVQSTFTAYVGPDGESLTFQLTVKDNYGLSATDSVAIEVSDLAIPGNNPPDAPVATDPLDGTILSAGPVTLPASPFSDIDSDSHILTHWLIRRADRLYPCSDYETCAHNDSLIYYVETSSDLTEHTASGLASGMKYLWQVGYEDSGSGSVSWSEQYTFTLGTSEADSNVQIAAGSEEADYRMAAFVQWPDDPAAESVVGDEIGAYDTNNTKMGAYDSTSGDGAYVEYGTNLSIEPGRAYWFLARNGLDITVNGVPVSLSEDIELRLKYNSSTGNGWNMIGCPNSADYYWGNVEVLEYDADGNIVFGPTAISSLSDSNDYINKRLWRWELGSYASGTAWMGKYEGYWVKVKKANVFLRFPASVQASLSNPATMFAYALSEGKRQIIRWLTTPRVAIADSGDLPPRPMQTLGISQRVDPSWEGGPGCFVGTAGP